MIQTYAHQKQLHEARLDIKTLECLFANLITEGTNCSPFESEIIVDKAKEVFAIGDHAEGNILLEKVLHEDGLLGRMKQEDFNALTPLLTLNINPYGYFALDFGKPLILEAA